MSLLRDLRTLAGGFSSVATSREAVSSLMPSLIRLDAASSDGAAPPPSSPAFIRLVAGVALLLFGLFDAP